MAAVVLVIQDVSLGEGRQVWPGVPWLGWAEAWPAVTPGQAAGGPHLALQAAHHSGQQPCFAALLWVGDKEVHVVTLRLPPERDSLVLCPPHKAKFF